MLRGRPRITSPGGDPRRKKTECESRLGWVDSLCQIVQEVLILLLRASAGYVAASVARGPVRGLSTGPSPFFACANLAERAQPALARRHTQILDCKRSRQMNIVTIRPAIPKHRMDGTLIAAPWPRQRGPDTAMRQRISCINRSRARRGRCKFSVQRDGPLCYAMDKSTRRRSRLLC